jgi:L-alanine-DL-glutamate epimerase-like enolase superfamily enzyme
MNPLFGVICKAEIAAFRIPTEQPESDGTLAWNSTTLVTLKLWCGSVMGLGYTYADETIVQLFNSKCKYFLLNKDPELHSSILNSIDTNMRNLGNTGITSMCVALVDNCIWDLRARLRNEPLTIFLGFDKDKIEAYGSGGFTSYTIKELDSQLCRWVDDGFSNVKMKIGRNKLSDTQRIISARKAIGNTTGLMVDANGAYSIREACAMSDFLADMQINWFEEPVHHRDMQGFNFIRKYGDHSINIISGEYAYTLDDFRALVENKSIDIMQADATRCGVSNFIKAAALCDIFRIPLSAHTAPTLHTHLCCAAKSAINIEYFFDHALIEKRFFDGGINACAGWVSPDMSRPGSGIELKTEDLQEYRIC